MKWLEKEFEAQLQAIIDTNGNVVIGKIPLVPVDILRRSNDYQEAFFNWQNEEIWPPILKRLDIIRNLVPSNELRFQELCAVDPMYLVPFVGAGMSRASGLDGWGDFLKSLLKQTDATCNRQEVRTLLRQWSYEAAADMVRAGMPSGLFNEQLKQLLYVEPGGIRGPIKYLPDLFTRLALTTNFDHIIEEVYRDAGLMGTVLYGSDMSRYRQMRTSYAVTLLKLHGDYDDEVGRVFTTDEYSTAYINNSPLLQELKRAVGENHLLFLGASLGADRTVELLRLATAGDPGQPKHFTFQPFPTSTRKRLKREHFLIERGIYPIWYPVPAKPVTEDFDNGIEALLVGMKREREKTVSMILPAQ